MALRAILFLCLSLLTACGGVDSTKNKVEKSYRFKVNGCDTGNHKFNAKSEAAATQKMCEALKDEGLNKGCAFNTRCRYFDLNCPGLEWETCDTFLDRTYDPNSGEE